MFSIHITIAVQIFVLAITSTNSLDMIRESKLMSNSIDLDWGSLVQATATVAAVLFGFLLSVIAENRAWKRRKSEQLRDAQLAKLLEFLNSLRTQLDSLNTVLRELQKASLDISQSGTDGVRQAMNAALRATGVSWVGSLEAGENLLRIKHSELRLLRLRQPGSGTAREAIDRVDRAGRTASEIIESVELSKTSVLETEIVQVRRSFELLIEISLDSLSS